MNLAACSQLFCPCSIIFSFDSRPEAEIQYYIDTKCEQTRGHLPQKGFDASVALLVVRFLHVKAKEPRVPFIRCQPNRAKFLLQPACKGGFAGAGQTDHQMKSRHECPIGLYQNAEGRVASQRLPALPRPLRSESVSSIVSTLRQDYRPRRGW